MTSIETTIIKFYCPIEIGSQFIGKQYEHLLPNCEVRRWKYVWIHLINDHLSFRSSQWLITNPPYKYQTPVITHTKGSVFFFISPFLVFCAYLSAYTFIFMINGVYKTLFMYINRYEWIIWTKVNYLLNNSVTLYLVRKTYFKHIYLKFISFKVNLSVH